MQKKSISPSALETIPKTCNPLAARQSLVLQQYPEMLSSSKSLLCTKPESVGDDQTESGSLGAPADGRKDEQLEISFVAQPEENQLERTQVSEKEGKVVPKRGWLALKSLSAWEGMEGPGQPHPVTPQTAANGISHTDQGRFFFQAEFRMDLETTQVVVHHFVKLAMVRQQQGTTARSTDRGGNYPIQADVGGNPETTPQITVRQAARLPIGR